MIEILSIHIPKTAGMTFYDVLKQQYGEGHCAQFMRQDYLQAIDGGARFVDAIGSDVHVVHGHLLYRDCHEVVARDNPKVIAWLRDPIDRLLSRFYYTQRTLAKVPESHPQWHKRNMTLEDYIHQSHKINTMSRFLEGIDLGDLFFVGLQEHFVDDLQQLAAELGWTDLRVPHKNDNRAYREVQPPPPHAIMEDMRRLNALDIELFESARALRNQRLNAGPKP